MAEQRNQIIVKQAFQYSMITEIILVMFILLNIILTAGYLIIGSIEDAQLPALTLPLVILGLELVGFFMVYKITIKSSHRIAGPLFIIERNLKKIEQGDLSNTLNLRKNDYFHEVTDQLNTTMESLRKRIETAQKLATTLQENKHSNEKMSVISAELLEELNRFKTRK